LGVGSGGIFFDAGFAAKVTVTDTNNVKKAILRHIVFSPS
jgi:hypothetical protein